MEVTYDALKKRVTELEEALQKQGCARDQTTTQYCVDVVERDKRIAELEKMQGTLLTMFRINMIRMNPNLSHEHIDDVLFRIIDQTIDCEFTERNTGDYHEGLEEGIKIGKAEAAARIAELKAALDFYACADHYQTHNAVAPNVVQTDRGAKARAALTGGKDEPKRIFPGIGEIGIDPEASPGNGNWYVKLCDGSYDVVGFDCEKEAIEELVAAAIRAKILESPIMSNMSTKPMGNMK